MHILEKIIRAAASEGRTALIPFVTAGYPTKEQFWDIVRELDESGADVIEIGVPFSDPVADGPVVEGASVIALENGVTLRWIMEGLLQRAMRARRACTASSCRICLSTRRMRCAAFWPNTVWR